MDRTELFTECVRLAVEQVEQRCPDALYGVRIAVDDVPTVTPATLAVPLALAVEPQDGQPAHVILYRRPLELRATSRSALRRLVHRVLVEQLASVTARSLTELGGPDLAD